MREPKHSDQGDRRARAGVVTVAAPAQSPGRAVARLARHLATSLTPFDLSISQYRVLAVLSGGAAASSAVAERLAVSPPSVTAVVDGLVVRGLVTRTPDPNDRRRLTLELTPAGSDLLRAADTAATERLAALATFAGGSTGGDTDGGDELVRSLERWHGALDAFRAAQRDGADQPAR
jgi:DNA-binding MarR family transcriptional regulator